MELILNVDIDGNVTSNVTLNLDGGMPLVHVPKSFGAQKRNDNADRDYALSEELYDKNKLNSIVVPILTVVGEDDSDRFTFITVVASYIKKAEAYIYYDKTNKALFMLPDPNMFEDGVSVTGYILGLRVSDSLYGNTESTAYDLPEPDTTDDPVTTVTMISRGLSAGNGYNYEMMISDTLNVNATHSQIIEWAVISDALSFGDDINYVTIVTTGIDTKKVSSLKSGSPDELLIPLIF